MQPVIFYLVCFIAVLLICIFLIHIMKTQWFTGLKNIPNPNIVETYIETCRKENKTELKRDILFGVVIFIIGIFSVLLCLFLGFMIISVSIVWILLAIYSYKHMEDFYNIMELNNVNQKK